MGRRGRHVQVCVCSRLDSDKNYINTADQYLRHGLDARPKAPSGVLLPTLRAKSKSLENLAGDDDRDAYQTADDGSWTDRDLHRIKVPRLDPFGQRHLKQVDVVRPKDIQNFKYSSLKKAEELVLPPIPKRADAEPGALGCRQLSVTMFVPDNTPVSTANNPEARSRGPNKSGGGRPKNERSTSNFVNQFGDIQEEGSDRPPYDVSLDYDTSHDEQEEQDGIPGERPRKQAPGGAPICVCPFPHWTEVTSGGGEVAHKCSKCGRLAPRSGRGTPKEGADILQVHHVSDAVSPSNDVGRNPRDVGGAISGHSVGSVTKAAVNVGGSRETSGLIQTSRASARDATVNSLEFRRASIASSLSELSDAAMDRAWREKLSQDAQIRDDLMGYDSREPSMTILSYGPSSQATDDGDLYSASSKLNSNRKNNGDHGNGTPSQNAGKKLTFFDSADRTPIDEDGGWRSDPEVGDAVKRRRGRGGGILRNHIATVNESAELDESSYPERTRLPLDAIPKLAYERALVKAQVESHPADHGILYLRLTEPYTFSYFEPLVKLCPCCNKPLSEVKGHNADGGKANDASKKPKAKKKPEGKDKKEKKERPKKKSKKFNEMKHIFGDVNVFDFYPGGKYDFQR